MVQFGRIGIDVGVRRWAWALERCLIAIVVPSALAGFTTLVFAQDPRPDERRATPRLDMPELQIDQVGPTPIGRPEEPAAKEQEESQDDLDFGDRLVPEASLTPQAIKKIQLELIRRGYEPGSPDGNFGERTRAAVKQYQFDRGWPASGNVTVKLLVALHGGDSFQRAAPPQDFDPKSTTTEASPLVLAIQDELKARGYDVSVDGRLDARTVRAIESYESYIGLEPTGEPSEQLLALIRSRVIP